MFRSGKRSTLATGGGNRGVISLFLQVMRQGAYSSGPTSLDVVCWALGIESPKGQMDGSMVAPAYERGEIEAIANYNCADVRATAAVYHHVRDGLLRFHKDW